MEQGHEPGPVRPILIATPANRQLGDDAIVPPPGSCGSAKDRVEKPAADTKVLDWFMVLKKCPHGN